MNRELILKKVAKKLKISREYTPAEFKKLINLKPNNMTKYLETNFPGDTGFIPKFLTFVDDSSSPEVSLSNAGSIIKQIVKEKLVSENYVKSKLRQKSKWFDIIFGDKYVERR